MNSQLENVIKIIGVPMDLGASRRGTDVGPSALRIAGLGAAKRKMRYTLASAERTPHLITSALGKSIL